MDASSDNLIEQSIARLDSPLSLDPDDTADLSLAINWAEQCARFHTAEPFQGREIQAFQKQYTGYIETHGATASTKGFAVLEPAQSFGKYSSIDTKRLKHRLETGFRYYNNPLFNQSLISKRSIVHPGGKALDSTEYNKRFFLLANIFLALGCPAIITFFATHIHSGERLRLTITYDTSDPTILLQYIPTTSMHVYRFKKHSQELLSKLVVSNIFLQIKIPGASPLADGSPPSERGIFGANLLENCQLMLLM